MAHPSHRLNQRIAVILLAAALLSIAVFTARDAFAASTLYFHDGPNWHQSGNYYSFGACADTQVGEKVWLQYSTDGSDLTLPPNAGNGTRTECALTNTTTCPAASYWTCAIPDNSGLTVKYRFYVMTPVNTWSGLVTPQRFFTTGELAVTLNDLSARSVLSVPDGALPLTVLFVVAVIIAAAGGLLRRR